MNRFRYGTAILVAITLMDVISLSQGEDVMRRGIDSALKHREKPQEKPMVPFRDNIPAHSLGQPIARQELEPGEEPEPEEEKCPGCGCDLKDCGTHECNTCNPCVITTQGFPHAGSCYKGCPGCPCQCHACADCGCDGFPHTDHKCNTCNPCSLPDGKKGTCYAGCKDADCTCECHKCPECKCRADATDHSGHKCNTCNTCTIRGQVEAEDKKGECYEGCEGCECDCHKCVWRNKSTGEFSPVPNDPDAGRVDTEWVRDKLESKASSSSKATSSSCVSKTELSITITKNAPGGTYTVSTPIPTDAKFDRNLKFVHEEPKCDKKTFYRAHGDVELSITARGTCSGDAATPGGATPSGTG